MRLGCIRIVYACVAGGRQHAPGTMLYVDDVLAARGEPDCLTTLEAMGLVLSGKAIRPQDEQNVPRYMTRMVHA